MREKLELTYSRFLVTDPRGSVYLHQKIMPINKLSRELR